MSGVARSALPIATTEILASLSQHRVLSTPQIREIHLPGRSIRWVRAVLARLAHADLAAFVPNVRAAGEPRRLWYVTEPGARAALDAGLLESMPRLLDAKAAAGPLRRHTLAVNEAAICFMRAARQRGDECGTLAWRHEVAHRLGCGRRVGSLFADAVLTYMRLTNAEVVLEQRFLELDRATLSVDRFAVELGHYGRLLNAEAKGKGESLWRSQYPSFPPVLCVLTGASRAALHRRRDTVTAILRDDSDFTGSPDLSIRLCLADDLIEQGPFAPIFTDVRDPERAVNWLVGDRDAKGI